MKTQKNYKMKTSENNKVKTQKIDKVDVSASETVNIFDISYEGCGVGKIDGKVCFVPKCLPGEKVKVQPIKQTKNFCVENLLSVEDPSPLRRPARCPHFDKCGGCDLQHVDWQEEQKIKTRILKRELSKIGFDGHVDFVCGKDRFFYRNKVKFEVENNKLGFYRAKSNQFLPIERCFISFQDSANIIDLIEKFLQENQFENLKNVYVKRLDKKMAICFLFAKNWKIDIKSVKKLQILKDFAIFFAFGDVLESDKTQIFAVSDAKGLENQMQAFCQVNSEVEALLYGFVQSLCKGKSVVNAYSGQGRLTLLLSEVAKQVFGIEMQLSAHKMADKNCANKKSIKNFCGKAEDVLPKLLQENHADLIVLDPAREGCNKKVMQAIRSGNCEEIVYISCNFASLVRDLAQILDKFRIFQVKIFDMFPCTANMETVAILKKIPNRPKSSFRRI